VASAARWCAATLARVLAQRQRPTGPMSDTRPEEGSLERARPAAAPFSSVAFYSTDRSAPPDGGSRRTTPHHTRVSHDHGSTNHPMKVFIQGEHGVLLRADRARAGVEGEAR
jgi:hypothetical protein